MTSGEEALSRYMVSEFGLNDVVFFVCWIWWEMPVGHECGWSGFKVLVFGVWFARFMYTYIAGDRKF